MNDSVKILFEGKHIRLLQAGCWEYAERVKASGAVVIVAVTDGGNLLLTEQFRVPVNRRVIELPAGLVGDGDGAESLAEAARRELLEETGYEAEAFVPFQTGPSSAGLTSELITIVQAKGLKRVSAGGGVENENITLHEVPLANLREWLKIKANEGALVDPKVFAGLWLVNERGDRE